MIRKCNETDRQEIMSFISNKPAENLFLISDIEAYGFDDPIQTVWGQYEQNKLVAILLRFNTNFIIYSEQEYDTQGFATIINTAEGKFEVSGLQYIVKKLRPYIEGKIIRDAETYYAKCTKLAYEPTSAPYKVEKLVAEHYEENIQLLQSIPEFENGNFTIQSRERAEQDQTGRTYIIRDEQGTMVTSATATAESKSAAMIVAVGTKPGYGKKGYATKNMEKLCSDLLAEGKTLCLFYSNPEAGAIYKRLGFEDIGMWTLLRYEK